MGYKNYNSFLISFLQFWYYPFLQQQKKNGKKEKILAVWKLIPCLLKSNYIHILNKHICVCQNTISRVEYRVRVLSFRILSVFGYVSKQTCHNIPSVLQYFLFHGSSVLENVFSYPKSRSSTRPTDPS